jgi:hypothetical protein
MNADRICTWLGLPVGSWPPSHYALLGLEPGASDLELIDQKVHERYAQLRSYQLSQPDEASAAMSRLSQAFICLTDPKAKQAYDDVLFGRVPPPPPAPAAPPAPAPPAAANPAAELESISQADPLAWLFGPWSQPPATAPPGAPPPPKQVLDYQQAPPPPVHVLDWSKAPPPPPRGPDADAPPEDESGGNGVPTVPVAEVVALPGVPVADGTAPQTATAAPPTPAAPHAPPVDPVVDAAQRSEAARRGLGTKRGVYQRIARTRALFRAWEQVGKFLDDPNRRLTRAADAKDFTANLAAVLEGLERFPPILGQNGQPGYYVVGLARQQAIVPIFRRLALSQREVLARDWREGRRLLVSHRQMLRDVVRSLRKHSRYRLSRWIWRWYAGSPRKQTRWRRLVLATAVFMDEHRGLVWALAIVLMLLLAGAWVFIILVT